MQKEQKRHILIFVSIFNAKANALNASHVHEITAKIKQTLQQVETLGKTTTTTTTEE